MRALYFGLASFWGFLAGSVAVLFAYDSLGGSTSAIDGGMGGTLLFAAIVALAGGVVVSMAYREMTRRR